MRRCGLTPLTVEAHVAGSAPKGGGAGARVRLADVCRGVKGETKTGGFAFMGTWKQGLTKK